MKSLPLAFAAALVATAAAAQGTNTGATNPNAPLPPASPNAPGGVPGATITEGTAVAPPKPAARTPGMNNPTNSVVAPDAQVTPTPGPVNGNKGTTAASGNGNQAVATTNANAQHPAHGANSFSRGEARTRIAGHGFQNVSDLHKDNNGVWRGKAMKDGQPVSVWLDYKGNVGQR